jgi:hypothetical protein
MARMWNPFRRRPKPRDLAVEAEQAREQLLMRAFRELAGTTNGVVYDLPRALRPEAVPGSIFVRGSSGWRAYLDAREQVDTGEPAVLLALRVLDADERELVVDWGTTYANMFLLVEPSDWRCDLTEPLNPFAHRLQAALSATLPDLARPDAQVDGWTRTTVLGALLRELFGTWRYWEAPLPEGAIEAVSLALRGQDETLWSHLRPELGARFPQAAFDRALASLYYWERELFGGPVTRARSAFRTRLGLPILGDARAADRALRRLVNEGRMTVVGYGLPGRPAFGPGHPVPDELSDEEFARFVMR